MKTSKVIKHFVFDESQRKNVTLGNGVRISNDGISLSLGNGGYSIDNDLYALTRVTTPKSVKRWMGFEVDDRHKLINGTAVTSVGYRLSDGVLQYYWNGSSWVVNNTSWNKEADVASHIDSFLDISQSQSIQVVINPRTYDSKYTPYIHEVKILYDSDIEWDEEYVGRSLVPALREQIRPIADFDVVAGVRAAGVNLNAIETPYNIVGIDSVYDLTDDPSALRPIPSSYNNTSKVVSIATPIAAGHRIRIRFTYEPEVAINTSQDYIELSKTPAIVIEEIHTNHVRRSSYRESVVNKSTGSGWRLGNFIQADLDMMIRWVADKTTDMNRIAGQLKRFFEARAITARGQDEPFILQLRDPMDHLSTPLQSELRNARLRAIIRNAIFYVSDAEQVYGIRRFVIDMGSAKDKVIISTGASSGTWDATFDSTFG